jgi:hypothetical protein
MSGRNHMKKHRLRFFLDYKICFWGADYEEGFPYGLMENDHLLSLSLETQQQVRAFLDEHDQSYDWGCPPNHDWTAEDCRRFNREYKRILSLVIPELQDRFLLCIEQFDLIEDAHLLAEFERRGREFIEERKTNVYH